jgi:PAS domain S-box-containing protein
MRIDGREKGKAVADAGENSFRLIVDAIPVLVCTLTPQWGVELVNQPLLDYFGKTLDELKNWASIGLVHPDDLDTVKVQSRHSAETGEPYSVEHRCRRHDGVFRWFQVRGFPLRNPQGQIVQWYVLLTDIEDRRRAEEALRSSERSLNSIIDAVPELAWSTRPDGFVEFLNHRWLNYTGLTAEDAHGWNWVVALHPADKDGLIEYWKTLMVSGEPGQYEARLRRFDGAYRWFLFRALPLKDESGHILRWFGQNIDIEDRKRAEEALNRARSELARVTRVTTLNSLTASIAHEINQPLSGIITNSSTCLRMLNGEPPNLEGARETVRRMIRDGNRASDVITRLRNLFKKKEVVAESVDLNEATREVVALSMSELQRNRVIVRTEFAADLPAVVGDRVQLQQVVLNLLRNASEAMNGIENRPRELLIKTERDERDHLRLSVKDAGTGFTPEAAMKLFEAFYTTKSDGMGIGLSISRSIIEAHHGRLWATTNEGPGATFSFSVPCGGIGDQAGYTAGSN